MSQSAMLALRARELGASVGSGILSWYGKLPLGVGIVIGVCTAFQLLGLFVTVGQCFSGSAFWLAPVSRAATLFLSHFLHTGWLHFIFNMLSFAPFGGYQERNMGTYPFLHFTLLLAVTCSVVYFAIAFVVGIVWSTIWTQCVAGLSGIIFALISLEANRGEMQTQDFFGIKVPGAMFPWVLLVVTQFLIPGAAFFGHLAGILTGILHARGFLDAFVPGPDTFSRLESAPFFGGLSRYSAYVGQPGSISLPTFNTPAATQPSMPSAATGASYYQSSYAGYGAVHGGNNQGNAAAGNAGGDAGDRQGLLKSATSSPAPSPGANFKPPTASMSQETSWGFSPSGGRVGDSGKEESGDKVAPTNETMPNDVAIPHAKPPGYDTNEHDEDSETQSNLENGLDGFDKPLGANNHAKAPIITKSHQLSHMQSIFSDSQKMAYVGLCVLLVTQMRTRHQNEQSRTRIPLKSFNAWADHFMNMLYAFVDVSMEEQAMIANLAQHGLVPADLSRGLIDDAEKAFARLQSIEAEEAWIKLQEAKWGDEERGSLSTASSSGSLPIPATATDNPPRALQGSMKTVSDIRYTILSHLFILCICDGFYDTRARTLLRAVAKELQISWWELARLEDTIGDQLRKQDSAEGNDVHGAAAVRPEEKTVKERNIKDSRGRWLYMGLATLAGGAVIGVTAGLAAPLIASGITAALTTFHVAGGVGAGVAAAMGGTTGIAIIASSGASIGGGMTGYKMHKRTQGILEFEFVALAEAMVAIQASKLKRDERNKKKKAKAAALAAAEEKERMRVERKNNDSWLGGEHTVEQAVSPTTPTETSVTLNRLTGGGDQTPTSLPSSSSNLKLNTTIISSTGSPVQVGRKGSFASQPPYSANSLLKDRRQSSTPSISSDRMSRDFRSDGSLATAPPILFSEGSAAAAAAARNSTDIEGETALAVAQPKANVLITIAGWVGSLDSRDDFTLPFSTLTPGLHGDQYTLVWETQALVELGHAVKLLMAEVTSFVVQQGIQYFLLPVLMAGLAGPLWALKLTYMVDNPWGNGLTKAKKAGRILADTLLLRVQGNRPVTLVGFSLGARVIYYCLLELASRGEAAYSIVEEAYLFGCPVMATTKEWLQIRSVVSGRLVNGYMTHDWVLSILYRASSAFLSDVAGLNPVKRVDGVENVCLDAVLKGGHLEYRAGLPKILKHVGFSVDSEVFDDEEKEIEQERMDEEAERERLKNEKEKEREEIAKKKQVEYEAKMKRQKEEEEVARAELAARKAMQQQQKPARRSWWGGSSKSLATSVESVQEELPFEIKEIKSTLPPLVLTLEDSESTATGRAGPSRNPDST
ncbi:hypothetical protein HDU80_007351 [Chytriomyces hyalinus]|nr:hypothetical protein HDU80_007351 [Chytriomyces hyalinus]